MQEQARRFLHDRWPILILIITLTAIVVVNLAKSHKAYQLHYGKFGISLEYAVTQDQQQKGLGDRQSMPKDHGMLFAFDRPNVYCFWMKDMHFPLDIVWLNDKKQVVYLKQNVSPSTYPDQFCPEQPSSYVLEVNADVTKTWGLTTGATLTF